MCKYILKFSGGAYDDYFEDTIPLETDDVVKFEFKILASKESEEFVSMYEYTIIYNGNPYSFDSYQIFELDAWFEKNKIISND